MDLRGLSISLMELAVEEQEVLCAECIAACNRLAGVHAHHWTLNRATNTLSGVIQWTEHEAIAQGTEALAIVVATLAPGDLAPVWWEMFCPDRPCPVRRALATETNTGFVRHDEEYDLRG